jgi:hypothetical protein
LVIQDSDNDRINKKPRFNGDPKAVIARVPNLDTIKLNPITLNRLKHWHFGNRANLPETITYDELFNILLDRVEQQKQQQARI